MISIIVAIAVNNVIGGDGKLLWHIPSDLKYFKSVTDGKVIIMGRKTFESLGRVLPNRYHVILTRNEEYKVDDENVKIVHSLKDLDQYVDDDQEHFVIGGGELFRTFLPIADRLYITWVGKEYEGDTTFPEIPANEFVLSQETESVDDKTGIELKFAIYERVENFPEEEDWDISEDRN